MDGCYVNVYFVDEHVNPRTVNARETAGSVDWNDADPPAVSAVIFESNPSGNLREERVVLAQPNIEPGAEAAPALANQNRSAGHQVAVVTFDAKPL